MPKIAPLLRLCIVGLLGEAPPSSASSLISCSRLDDVEREAVWSGKDAASDVSFSPSAVVISSSVS